MKSQSLLLTALVLSTSIPALAHEPPRNPYLSPSSPAAPHDNASAQQSTPNPGPTSNEGLSAQFLPTDSIGGMMLSPPYADGQRVGWLSTQAYVYKFAFGPDGLSIIDAARKPGSFGLPRGVSALIADRLDGMDRDAQIRFLHDELELQTRIGGDGIYAFVSSENRFYFVEDASQVVAFGDAEPGNRLSRATRLASFRIPADQLASPRDRILGMLMTHDGKVVFVTRGGVVGIVDRSLDPATARFVRLAGGPVTNSLCIDERGGIYVVSEQLMHRVQWTGTELSTDPATGAWSAPYDTDAAQGGLRVGAGSGSTPTLMGGPDEPDQLVVITDGSTRMNLVAFWRDAIPANWRGIAGQDRRIAGIFPVTYGNPELAETQSEQSVAVTGYGAFVVNNTLQRDLGLDHMLDAFFSGDEDIQPMGVERIDWDPRADRFRSRWSRADVSMPNTVPVISSASKIVYGIGARGGQWLLWGLDWETGRTRVDFNLGRSSRWNSSYMITMPFPDGSIISGNFWGIIRIGQAAN